MIIQDELPWIAKLFPWDHGEAKPYDDHHVLGDVCNNALDRPSMNSSNSTQVHMKSRFKLSKESAIPPLDSTMDRSIVGSFHCLVHTPRYQLCRRLYEMVCLMVNPTMEYMRAVEDLLRFVACTTHYGLCKVKGASELKLIGYRRTTMMTRPMILMNAKAFVGVLA